MRTVGLISPAGSQVLVRFRRALLRERNMGLSKSDRESTRADSPAPRKRKAKGFTLVELLVVIGIIAVLISILLPTIGRARKQANTIACMATLRSIGQAMFIYVGENKGSLPYSYYTSSMPSGSAEVQGDANSTVYVWWSVLRAYLRRGGNMDNSIINNDGSTSTRFMRAFACPEGHEPEAGCDFASNMVAMPELPWESYVFYRSVN